MNAFVSFTILTEQGREKYEKKAKHWKEHGPHIYKQGQEKRIAKGSQEEVRSGVTGHRSHK